MARKKTNNAQSAAAEAPAPTTLEEAIKKLIDRGQRLKSLTYEEINAVFENVEDVNPERIDELFEDLAGRGIEVVDEQKEKNAASYGDDASSLPAGISLDDPVRMYLKEIGRVPLLSMQEEKTLAMAIEAGELEAQKNGSESNETIVAGLVEK